MTPPQPAPRSASGRREPLTRERVLEAAVALADDEGLPGLTMRALAAVLGVEAMSLYHHVANKDALLDGVVEVVMGEVHAAARTAEADAPSPDVDWRGALRSRVLAAREVMLAHPWAPAVLESRTELSPPVIVWFDGIVGILRDGGLDWDLVHHSVHAIGSRALGFSQELFQPDAGTAPEGADAEAEAQLAAMAALVPNLAGMLAAVAHDDPDTTLGWCDDQEEFEFGIDVLLAGIEQRRTATP